MKIGFVILAHQNIFRVREVVNFLASSSAPVALHVDARVSPQLREMITYAFSHHPHVYLIDPITCHWGDWSLVQATISATRALLENEPDLDYILNTSGACLPLYTVNEMREWLGALAQPTDFIESYATHEKRWIFDGLVDERITIAHPFSWKKSKFLFNLNVALWRKFGLKRHLPDGLQIAFGSQWWCLSSATLRRAFASPKFEIYVKFFSKSWIPDESFFQSLVREFSTRLEKQSLTFYQFDHMGKPHNFYNDHLADLKHLDYFFARKIWAGADELYSFFLNPHRKKLSREPKIAENFLLKLKHANSPRERYRNGLLAQHTIAPLRRRTSANTYHIFVGMENWQQSLTESGKAMPKIQMMGDIFRRSQLVLPQSKIEPSIKDSHVLRDYAPEHFLLQQIWLNRDKQIAFFARPPHLKPLAKLLTSDSHAQVYWVKGAWLLDIAKRKFTNPTNLAITIAALMRQEDQMITTLLGKKVRGRINIINLGKLYHNARIFDEKLPITNAPDWKTQIETYLPELQRKVASLDQSFLTKYELDTIELPSPPENVIDIRQFQARA